MIINLERFIAVERPFWTELERALEKLEADPGTRMDLDQLRRFHLLYERTAADLARITTFAAEPETRRYLENLVARAYAEIHETRSRERRLQPLKWFFRVLPQNSTGTCAFLAVFIGITVGTRAAVKVNSPLDQGTRVVSLVGVSIPVFWLGVILLAVFYYYLGWAPEPGRIDKQFDTAWTPTNFYLIDSVLGLNWAMFKNAVAHLVLPSITLCFASTAIIVRIMRSSMLEVLESEYVRTARSKGLPAKDVIKKHARRNALIPTTTVVGLSFGGLLGGEVRTDGLRNLTPKACTCKRGSFTSNIARNSAYVGGRIPAHLTRFSVM